MDVEYRGGEVSSKNDHKCNVCKGIPKLTAEEYEEHISTLIHHINMEKVDRGMNHECKLCTAKCKNSFEYGVHLNSLQHKQTVDKKKGNYDHANKSSFASEDVVLKIDDRQNHMKSKSYSNQNFKQKYNGNRPYNNYDNQYRYNNYRNKQYQDRNWNGNPYNSNNSYSYMQNLLVNPVELHVPVHQPDRGQRNWDNDYDGMSINGQRFNFSQGHVNQMNGWRQDWYNNGNRYGNSNGNYRSFDNRDYDEDFYDKNLNHDMQSSSNKPGKKPDKEKSKKTVSTKKKNAKSQKNVKNISKNKKKVQNTGANKANEDEQNPNLIVMKVNTQNVPRLMQIRFADGVDKDPQSTAVDAGVVQVEETAHRHDSTGDCRAQELPSNGEQEHNIVKVSEHNKESGSTSNEPAGETQASSSDEAQKKKNKEEEYEYILNSSYVKKFLNGQASGKRGQILNNVMRKYNRSIKKHKLPEIVDENISLANLNPVSTVELHELPSDVLSQITDLVGIQTADSFMEGTQVDVNLVKACMEDCDESVVNLEPTEAAGKGSGGPKDCNDGVSNESCVPATNNRVNSSENSDSTSRNQHSFVNNDVELNSQSSSSASFNDNLRNSAASLFTNIVNGSNGNTAQDNRNKQSPAENQNESNHKELIETHVQPLLGLAAKEEKLNAALQNVRNETLLLHRRLNELHSHEVNLLHEARSIQTSRCQHLFALGHAIGNSSVSTLNAEILNQFQNHGDALTTYQCNRAEPPNVVTPNADPSSSVSSAIARTNELINRPHSAPSNVQTNEPINRAEPENIEVSSNQKQRNIEPINASKSTPVDAVIKIEPEEIIEIDDESPSVNNDSGTHLGKSTNRNNPPVNVRYLGVVNRTDLAEISSNPSHLLDLAQKAPENNTFFNQRQNFSEVEEVPRVGGYSTRRINSVSSGEYSANPKKGLYRGQNPTGKNAPAKKSQVQKRTKRAVNNKKAANLVMKADFSYKVSKNHKSNSRSKKW